VTEVSWDGDGGGDGDGTGLCGCDACERDGQPKKSWSRVESSRGGGGVAVPGGGQVGGLRSPSRWNCAWGRPTKRATGVRSGSSQVGLVALAFGFGVGARNPMGTMSASPAAGGATTQRGLPVPDKDVLRSELFLHLFVFASRSGAPGT
jgi:hypothetical protein